MSTQSIIFFILEPNGALNYIKDLIMGSNDKVAETSTGGKTIIHNNFNPQDHEQCGLKCYVDNLAYYLGYFFMGVIIIGIVIYLLKCLSKNQVCVKLKIPGLGSITGWCRKVVRPKKDAKAPKPAKRATQPRQQPEPSAPAAVPEVIVHREKTVNGRSTATDNNSVVSANLARLESRTGRLEMALAKLRERELQVPPPLQRTGSEGSIYSNNNYYFDGSMTRPRKTKFTYY